MKHSTKQQILDSAKKIFATSGYDGLSMRNLATESGVGLSSIYHFFEDKDVLLKQLFDTTSTSLGIERAKLPVKKTAQAQLLDIIKFQFNHIEDVVFIFKYYLHYRSQFDHQDSGYVPIKSYLHIEEVIRNGVENKEFDLKESEIASESKLITHAINGFLLEYYPTPPTGKEFSSVTKSLHSFIYRSLTAERRVM